jgi:hypothetical protein
MSGPFPFQAIPVCGDNFFGPFPPTFPFLGDFFKGKGSRNFWDRGKRLGFIHEGFYLRPENKIPVHLEPSLISPGPRDHQSDSIQLVQFPFHNRGGLLDSSAELSQMMFFFRMADKINENFSPCG